MKTTAAPLHFDHLVVKPLKLIKVSIRTWLLSGLTLSLVSLLFSAFALIYVKDLNRRVVNDLQLVSQKYYQLQAEQGRLLLERSTWSAQARIQEIASQELNLHVPAMSEITITKR